LSSLFLVRAEITDSGKLFQKFVYKKYFISDLAVFACAGNCRRFLMLARLLQSTLTRHQHQFSLSSPTSPVQAIVK